MKRRFHISPEPENGRDNDGSCCVEGLRPLARMIAYRIIADRNDSRCDMNFDDIQDTELKDDRESLP
jgi:hypothetical protein